ncbi:DCC family protein At1g52590, chloroplastic-like [Zingiber officinale]|uniref:Thiol-disulfide oxidoreductase DCC n=1 Tax=Zingiber officinale TaxID=94328 RepID=A0A8J5HRI5_ZINOF|nr:DCC family protein At1g52590, chloroplastic-like [Zingiber officinale]KAG6534007.1 hypothetical protein ZIOFF_007888 [Zingiber officinale]
MHLNCGSADANVHDFLPRHLANAQRSQRVRSNHQSFSIGTVSQDLAFSSSHSAMTLVLPVSLGSLPIGATRVRFKQTQAPVAALGIQSPPSSFSGSVDWVKVTDGEFFQTDSRPIMLFDGVCNLCNGGVRFVRDNDRNRMIRYEALQSESGRKLLQRCGRSSDDISSVVLVEKDRCSIKSEAVLRIMEFLGLPFPQLAFFLKIAPLFVRDFSYDIVANNRYALFGRTETESCEI